jgi:hypothetical protein
MAIMAMETTFSLDNPRQLNEVIIQFFAIRVGTILLLGHLTTLRGLPKKEQLFTVSYFILGPIFPLVQLVHRFCLVVEIACTRPWPDDKPGYLSYLLSMVLDIKATTIQRQGPEESGIDLLNTSFDNIQRVSTSRSLLMWARIVVLLVGLAQSAASSIICLRRMTIPNKKTILTDNLSGPVMPISDSELEGQLWELAVKFYTLTPINAVFDTWNLFYAIGGLVTIFSSLVISICGWSWEIPQVYWTPQDIEQFEPLFLIPRASAYSSSLIAYTYLPMIYSDRYISLQYRLTLLTTYALILMPGLWVLPKPPKPRESRFLRLVLACICGKDYEILRSFFYGIVLFCVLLWTSVGDLKEVHRCTTNGTGCEYPLVSWKDPWSDKIWTF